MKTRIGIIGIVGNELTADLPGTLQRLRALGYSGIELGFASMEPHGGVTKVAAALKSADMELITIHTGREALRDNLAAHKDALAATGCRYVTISWSPADSAEVLKQDAALYQELAPALQEVGARICYHNHEHEFLLRHGTPTAMDLLLRQTTDCLSMHFDVAWGTFGGINPVAFIERHKGRVPLLHLKDFYDLSIRGCFATLGTGVVDIKGCVQAGLAAGTEWFTIEQDQPRGISGMDLATASILNLRDLGFEPA